MTTRQIRIGRAGLVTFALFLTSCALEPRAASAPRAVPGSDPAGPALGPSPDVSRWLEPGARDDDPFAGKSELELTELLARVIERNPSLTSMLHAWRAAAARAPQVAALDDPEFNFMFGPRTVDRIGRGSEAMEFGFAYRPELSQAFPWPGKLRLREEQAGHEAAAVLGDAAAVRERLLGEAKDAYFELHWAQRALEINAAVKAILQDTLANAHTRYEAGTASKQDALHAEVELERLRHQDLTLTRMERVAQARLNTLLNRRPEAVLPPPPGRLGVPAAPGATEDLQRVAIETRPELQALASRLEAAETAVAAARKEYYPDFMVSAAYDAFWQEDELRPSLGLGFNIPLQRGRRRAALTEAEETREALRAELAESAAEVALEVESALQGLREAVHGDQIFQQRLLPAARESLDAALSGYESGELVLPAVLMAQQALVELELEAVEVQVSARKQFAELERAVGRPLVSGWSDREVGS